MNTDREPRTISIQRPSSPSWGGWVAMLLVVWLTGCATTAGPRDGAGASSELLPWVDAELSPYLVEQLSRHPRFKREPVLLVATEGPDVRVDIDALTASVRERLLDHLLQAQGVAVAWRPSTSPSEHHRHSTRSVCDVGYRAQYSIGIDISPLPGGGHRLSVRALDRHGEGWVSGFGKRWQGRLLPAERRALAQRRPDEYLRGLRSLPFEASQTDLLAGYLARNLDCLLSERGAGGTRVWVGARPGAREADGEFSVLVARHLGRESRLILVDAPHQAEITVFAELRPLDAGLHQGWLTAVNGPAAERELTVSTDGYIESGVARDAFAVAPIPAGEPLLSGLRLSGGGDPEIELGRGGDAFVFAIGIAPDAALLRLSPGGCGNDLSGLRRFPRGGAFRLSSGGESLQSIYALATRDVSAAERLQARVEGLPSPCQGESPLRGDTVSADLWLRGLERDLGELGSRMDWWGLRVSPEPFGMAGAGSP